MMKYTTATEIVSKSATGIKVPKLVKAASWKSAIASFTAVCTVVSITGAGVGVGIINYAGKNQQSITTFLS